MRTKFLALSVLLGLVSTPAAHAKGAFKALPIEDVLTNATLMEGLNGVSFSFGDEIMGAPIATSRVERTVRGVMRSDRNACEKALVEALKELRRIALERGAHSVQAIKSTVTGAVYSSDTDFLCETTLAVARVHVEGKIVMEALTDSGASPDQKATPSEAPAYRSGPRPVSKPEIDPDQLANYGDPEAR